MEQHARVQIKVFYALINTQKNPAVIVLNNMRLGTMATPSIPPSEGGALEYDFALFARAVTKDQ
jgi:hypothetical protein